MNEDIIETNQGTPEFDNNLIYEASKDALLLDNGKCGACERTGFPILLVRKSVVPNHFKKEIDWSKGMLPLNDDREPKQSLDLHKYAYRTLREGYLYILLEKRSVKEWEGTNLNLLKVMAYEITNSGAFRLRELRDIKGSRPKELPLSCINQEHQFKAKFITIDNKIYQKAWIAYSPYKWEKEMIELYRNNEAERNLRFTIVDLSKNNPEEQTSIYQKRSFPISDFIAKKKYLLEMECDNNEVIDFFDEESQTQFRKKILAGKENSVSKIDKEIGKGVFYTKNINLDNVAENTTEEILAEFSNLFCTASHFNSLRINGEIANEFQKAINNYKIDNENKLNKNYQTSDISVVMVEDSLGLAEELSIQRRQLLAPVMNGLMGSSQEQVKAIQRKLNPKFDSIKESIILDDAPLMKNINPAIADAFYQDNILDLEYNRRYKAIHQYADKLRFLLPVQSWLTKKMSQGIAGIFGARGEAIKDYFDNQISLSTNRPLLYFKPETSFARNQYKNIDSYKDILKTNQINEDSSDCIFFVFYNPNVKNSALRDRDNAINNAKYLLKKAPYSGSEDEIFLDNILVQDVVGDKEFAAENNYNVITYPYQATAYGSTAKYFYFRFVSEKGSCSRLSAPPLGDYSIIKTSPEQKQQILELYKKTSPYLNRSLDVVVVRFPNAKSKVAKWKANNQWNQKENEHIYNDSITSYEKLDNIAYNNILNYAKQVSKDYFTYLLWLFDEKNNVKFWLTENNPDTSDIHINSLSNLLIILDSGYLGNLYLEEQSHLWAKLLNSKSSLYFHLLEGNPYTLFNVASGNLDDKDSALTAEVKAILAKKVDSGPTQNLSTKVNNPLSGVKSAIAKSKFITNLKLEKNVTVGAFLKEELVKLSLGNFAKSLSNNNTVNINREVANFHLVKAMNMFSNGVFKEYKVSIPVSNIPNFLNNLGDSAPIVLPKNGKLITSGGATIKARFSTAQNSYVLGRNDLAKASGKSVEFTMIMTFADEADKASFENTLYSNKGYAKPEKFIGSNVVEYEELQAAKFQTKKNWRAEVLDTSISGVMNVFTLVYQHIQISLLQERLKTLNDSALIDKVSAQITKAHISIALIAAESTLTVVKFMALFGERDKTLYDLCKKTGKGLGYVGKTVAIVDSFSDLCHASTALKRGDTGSFGFMINSTIGFVAAGIGLFLGISMPWTIALLLAPYVVNFLFGSYDDGSGWDEMDKWINRSIFGRFDRGDLFPPYPISDTGNYLSEQDYYLASRKGLCRTAHYALTILGNIGDEARTYGQFSKPEAKNFMGTYYNLHLVIQLPDFVKGKATFEGTVTIRHKDGNQNDTILSISDGDNALTIKPIQCDSDYFLQANDQMIRKGSNELYRYFEDKDKDKDKDNNPRLDQFKQHWLDMQQVIFPQTATNTTVAPTGNLTTASTKDSASTAPQEQTVGLFMIDQMLGRIAGEFEVICIIKYWPQGKTDNDDQPLFPFLLSYQYNVLTWGEYMTDKVEGAKAIFY